MILYMLGIGIAVGFAALLWRQHKSGAGWQREVSFFVDLMALSATALVVGVLAMVQLSSDGELAGAALAPLPTAAAPELDVLAPADEVVGLEEGEAVLAEGDGTEPIATPPAGPTVEPTVTPETSPTVEPSASPTREATATTTPEPTATPAPTATAEATATPAPTGTPVPPAPPAPARTYTVQPGDTLSEIARDLGTTTSAVLAANPGTSADNLQIGQVLTVPQGSSPAPAPSSGGRTYTVQQGDTLNGIAVRLGVTTTQITALNPGLNASRLSIGQVIRVP